MSSKKRQVNDSSKANIKKAKTGDLVNSHRMRVLKGGDIRKGPVLYWMSRDQRSSDNWALLYSAQVAQERDEKVAVCFNLVTEYLHAGARQFVHMLKGLQEVAPLLEKKNIRFHLLRGQPQENVPQLVENLGAGLLVTDYSPLRLGRQWRDEVGKAISCPLHEVDAHNIVPVWHVSTKREYGARTIRRKIQDKLPEFLQEYPDMPDLRPWDGEAPHIDWDGIIAEAADRGKAVPELAFIAAGESAGREALLGKNGFLSEKRFKAYAKGRNDPNQSALSGMSPYFHYGQLAPQRAALEVVKRKALCKESADSFLEESIIRRELSDNFCHYEPNYDKISAASGWAQETLEKHKSDKREHLYTRDQLERAETADDLWNASQREMVHLGKMHGFMRMYWAKKILEWTDTPENALDIAIYLNDKYEIDGRDPNGYVGCMWAICGIHDQGWAERDVFGKIRYMNYNGCKRKFDVAGYINKVEEGIKRLVK